MLYVNTNFAIDKFVSKITWIIERPGGAGSEVWNRVYMIAPVKKFGRVRLSRNFPWKQIWRRMRTWKDDEFLLSFKFSRVQISRKGFYELFQWAFGHQEAWCMNSAWVTSLIVIRDLGKFSYNFRATILLYFLYFSTYSGIKTLFLILNTCYAHNILVLVLQQSYVNFH